MNFIDIEYREREDSWAMSDLQSHDYYELYFLLDGTRDFFLGDRIFNISATAFCVIPPFSMHKTSGGRYKRINVNVSPDLLSEREISFLDSLAEQSVYTMPGAHCEGVRELLRIASEVELVDVQEKRRITLSLMHSILYLLSLERLSPIEHGARTRIESRDTAMLQVAAYIGAHYAEELTLDAISERFYISKNSLCRKFREAMSCSVIQYLGFVRLSRAKELLSTTAKSIDEISDLCGYSSPNYFSLIFKKSVGISPREYRKTK